jgi:hypothetical protein
MEIEESDAGLDDAVTLRLVDLDDAVHPAQVEHHRARHARRGTAIAEVLAARDRPQRNAKLVCDFQDALDLRHVRGSHRRRRCMARLFARRVGVDIGVAVLIGGQHPFPADDAGEGGQRLVELRRADAGRENEFHAGEFTSIA